MLHVIFPRFSSVDGLFCGWVFDHVCNLDETLCMLFSVFLQVEFNPTATDSVAFEPWCMAKGVKRPAEVQPTPKKKLSVKKKGKVGAEVLQSPKKEAGGKRRLGRKNSDDAAIRSLRLKLGMFPKSQVDNNINTKTRLPW